MKKRCTLLLLCFLLLTSGLTACRADRDFADGLSVDSLAEQALEALPDGDNYRTAQKEYLNDYFVSPEYLLESVIHFSADGNNLNEFGIYHVQDGKAGEMKQLLCNYLERSYEKNKAWYDSYIPQETYKLRDAEVQVYGNYAVYAILPSDVRRSFFEAISGALSK